MKPIKSHGLVNVEITHDLEVVIRMPCKNREDAFILHKSICDTIKTEGRVTITFKQAQ